MSSCYCGLNLFPRKRVYKVVLFLGNWNFREEGDLGFSLTTTLGGDHSFKKIKNFLHPKSHLTNNYGCPLLWVVFCRKDMLKSKPLEPQNVTLVGNMVFTKIIKLT